MHVLDNFPLATLREYIDWSPFFHTWGMKGIYPRILNDEVQGSEARKIFADANALLDRIVAENLITARGVYGLFPATAIGDDVQLYTDEARTELASASTSSASKPTAKAANPAARSSTSSLRRKPACPTTSAPSPSPAASVSRNSATASAPPTTTTTPSWPKPSPTASPKPSPSVCTSACATSGATAARRTFTPAELIQEKYRGIRPAPGYPACPDHTEKGTIWKLLDVEANTGIKITESFAMWPGSSVSGLYFAHPEARYFSLGKIGRDQVADYAARKQMIVNEVERWLGPNLNYDPAS